MGSRFWNPTGDRQAETDVPEDTAADQFSQG